MQAARASASHLAHCSVLCLQAADIQQALKTFGRSMTNLRRDARCELTTVLEVNNAVGVPKFAPNGHAFATWIGPMSNQVLISKGMKIEAPPEECSYVLCACQEGVSHGLQLA